MPMRRDFFGTCPKEIQEPESNEDWFEFSDDCTRLALCDGASESYNSLLWAKIICQKFIVDPKFGSEWVSEALCEYIALHDFSKMSWSQQSAFERGSFCTLLGVEYNQVQGVVELLAIGDCIALLFDGDEFVDSWPYNDPERFKEHPTLLATLTEHNSFVMEPGFFWRTVKTIHLNSYKQPRLFCMTDALGEWALKQLISKEQDVLATLSSITSKQELCDLVIEERAAKRMRVDDSTLIILSFGGLPINDGISIP